jgi:hypothetical protein
MASVKQSPLLFYLIMLLGLVAGFLYNMQSDPAASVPPVPAALQLTSLRGLENLRIDYALLESEQFRQLQVYGELPVQTGTGGKDDPFQ